MKPPYEKAIPPKKYETREIKRGGDDDEQRKKAKRD